MKSSQLLTIALLLSCFGSACESRLSTNTGSQNDPDADAWTLDDANGAVDDTWRFDAISEDAVSEDANSEDATARDADSTGADDADSTTTDDASTPEDASTPHDASMPEEEVEEPVDLCADQDTPPPSPGARTAVNRDPAFIQVYVNNIENLKVAGEQCRGDWTDLIYYMKTVKPSPDLFLVQQIANQAQLNDLLQRMTNQLPGIFRESSP
jgi:hypothetical protein